MSEEPASSPIPRHETRWLGWTLGLLATPVLYVLMLPPFYYAMPRDSGGLDPAPWVMQLAEPYMWLCIHTKLGPALVRYSLWWEQVYYGSDTLMFK